MTDELKNLITICSLLFVCLLLVIILLRFTDEVKSANRIIRESKEYCASVSNKPNFCTIK